MVIRHGNLYADEGIVLTNGNMYAKAVYLAEGADASEWREVAEAEKLKAEEGEVF